jgi:hypothetical protein
MFAWLFCLMLGACKSRDPAPAAPTHAATPAEANSAPRVEPAPLHVPPEPTFELPDDVAADPAETLREMRHDCCDEMPASEVEATIRAGEAPEAKAPTPSRKKSPSARQSRNPIHRP